MIKKLGLLFWIVVSVTTAFGQSSDAALTTQSNVIRNESSPGGNTRARVADMVQALIDSKVSRINDLINDNSFATSSTTSVPSSESVKQFVLQQIIANTNSIDWKNSVKVATTANITLSGTQTIDGIAVSVADRVLVKDETNATLNGIYVVASGAWARDADMDIGSEFQGAVVSVDQGTVNAETTWKQTAINVTLGTTNITWSAFLSTSAIYTATAAGTNTYTATTSPAISAYSNWQEFVIKFTNSNTGVATLNLNSLGAKAIKKNGSTALSSGDISAGQIFIIVYDGTNFQLAGSTGITAAVTSITATSPLTGGTITTTGSIGIQNAASDGSTKGAASFNASDFDASSGNISIDYTNGQAASASNKGFLTTTDWSTFNGKESALTFSSPLSRSTNTISIPASSGSQNGYLSSSDWTTFNNKVSSPWTLTGSDIYFTNKVLIGATGSPMGTLHTVTTSTSAPRGVIFDQYNAGTNSSRVYFRKGRGTFASPGLITTGDALGNLTFAGYDGTNFTDAAQFLVTSSGTISTGVVQSTMALQTANSSGTLTTGLLVDGSQQVGVGAAPSSARFHVTGAGTTTGIAFKLDDNSGNNRVSVADNGNSSFTQSAQSSSSPNFITFTPGAHTGLTSGTEATDILFNLNRTVQFTNGALTTQRAIYVRAPTYAFTSASTLASASTFAISGAPVAGTNATITDPYALSVEGGRVLFSTSGGSTTKGDVTISDGSSSGKLLFDVKKSNSVFSVYQEGRTVWTNASLSLAANTGFMESVGTNTLTFNYSTTGDAGYYIKHSPSLAIAAGATSTEFAYFYRANPSVAFGTTSTPFWMFDLNPSTTGTPGSLYGVTVRPTNFNNGFGTGTPTSTVQVNGSFASAYVSKTGSYTLTSTDGTVEVTSGTNTQTLPTAVGITGRWYYITNSGSGTVTVATTSSQTFANISGTPTSMSIAPFQTRGYQSNGANWLVTIGTIPGQMIGTATNDDAIAGNIGEEINSVVSTYTNFTTSATYQNIASITLTAGDWDLSAFFTYSSNSATITAASNAIFVISTTTASASGSTEGINLSYVPQAALLGTSKFTDVISPYRVSISATTTYYLNAQATFSVGNPQYVGRIRARRIR
jgi:hypothetical protein